LMGKDIRDPAYATLDQLMAVRERVSAVEGDIKEIKATLKQMDKRIDDINRRLESVETELKAELKGLCKKIDSNFKWVLGFWLSTIALIISTMIPVALKILGVI